MKNRRLFLLIITFLYVNVSNGQSSKPRYDIIEIGEMLPHAINDKGQVVGGRDGSAGIWDQNTGFVDLGITSRNMGLGINNIGQVTGSFDVGYGNSIAFFWDPNSGMIDLGSLSGIRSRGWDLNDNGQVAGESLTYDIENHAFIWTDDNNNGQSDPCEMRDLGTLGGNESRGLGINNSGKVVGSSRLLSGETHPFIWDINSGMMDLGIDGQATSINNFGDVVGYSGPYGFIWNANKGVTSLGTLEGLTYSNAQAINDYGQVVGSAFNPPPAFGSSRAFLWNSNQGMIDLNEMLPEGSKWRILSSAYGINNNGQIVGKGITDSNEYNAYLMSPKPLCLITPVGDDWFAAGSILRITWVDYRADNSCPGEYFLKFSPDNGQNWIPIDSNTISNTCSYDWTVPLVDSNQCLIEINDVANADIRDVSDNTFCIYQCIATFKGDSNNDCYVNFKDFAILANDWLLINGTDMMDFANLVPNWCKCGNPYDPNCSDL